jgi:hypothetical protein
MCLRFVVLEGAATPHHDRSLFVLERTLPSTLRTGLLFAQLTRLLLGRCLQSSRQQTAHGRYPDVLHLGQINVETGTLFTPLLAYDDFSPAFSEFFDTLEIFRCRFACSHVASLQRVPSISPDEILP